MRNIDIQLFLRYVCMPFVVTLFMVAGSGKCVAQINTDQVMNIGRNALYFEDYILSIQYFNQVIKAKPYLADPYFYRAIAKLELEDYKGAEEDCSLAIERNPFIIDAYQVRGIARQVLKDYKGAIADYDEGLNQMPEHQVFLMNKAVCECEVGEYAEADSTYARLISIYPNYANAYLGRAQLRLEQKDTVSAIDKSHPAGQHKRWFLRALQEVYDATKENDIRYTLSMELPGRPDKPSMFNGYGDYLHDFSPGEAEKCYIRYREIPVLKEEFLKGKLSERGTVLWKRDPEDWFSFRVPDSFEISEGLDLQENGQEYIVEMPEGRAAFLTFVLPEQGVGFIDFEIEAPEGTIVEAMVQESHDKACTLWLDTYFYSWTRFICKEGYNHFRSFDTESFLYLQLHIRNAKGKVRKNFKT